MPDKQDVEELQGKIATMERAQNRAEGELEGLMKVLKADFDCDDIKEAEELYEELEEKEKEAKEEFDTAYEDFLNEWGDKLESIDA